MKLLGLIAAAAIALYLYKQRLEPGKDSVDTAMAEFEQTAPTTPPSRSTAAAATSAPKPATSNLRRPVDRTRSVLEQVKQRNGDGEF